MPRKEQKNRKYWERAPIRPYKERRHRSRAGCVNDMGRVPHGGPDFIRFLLLCIIKPTNEERIKVDKLNPEKSPFSELHHVSIVVRDIEKSVKYFTSIGLGPFTEYPPMREYTKINVPDEEGFYNLRIMVARIGPVDLQLIQPGEGESLYKDHLEKKGEGVYHLGFVVDDIAKSEAEVKMKGLCIISNGRREDGSGFAYLDTAEKGAVTLLIRQSPPTK